MNLKKFSQNEQDELLGFLVLVLAKPGAIDVEQFVEFRVVLGQVAQVVGEMHQQDLFTALAEELRGLSNEELRELFSARSSNDSRLLAARCQNAVIEHLGLETAEEFLECIQETMQMVAVLGPRPLDEARKKEAEEFRTAVEQALRVKINEAKAEKGADENLAPDSRILREVALGATKGESLPPISLTLERIENECRDMRFGSRDALVPLFFLARLDNRYVELLTVLPPQDSIQSNEELNNAGWGWIDRPDAFLLGMFASPELVSKVAEVSNEIDNPDGEVFGRIFTKHLCWAIQERIDLRPEPGVLYKIEPSQIRCELSSAESRAKELLELVKRNDVLGIEKWISPSIEQGVLADELDLIAFHFLWDSYFSMKNSAALLGLLKRYSASFYRSGSYDAINSRSQISLQRCIDDLLGLLFLAEESSMLERLFKFLGQEGVKVCSGQIARYLGVSPICEEIVVTLKQTLGLSFWQEIVGGTFERTEGGSSEQLTQRTCYSIFLATSGKYEAAERLLNETSQQLFDSTAGSEEDDQERFDLLVLYCFAHCLVFESNNELIARINGDGDTNTTMLMAFSIGALWAGSNEDLLSVLSSMDKESRVICGEELGLFVGHNLRSNFEDAFRLCFDDLGYRGQSEYSLRVLFGRTFANPDYLPILANGMKDEDPSTVIDCLFLFSRHQEAREFLKMISEREMESEFEKAELTTAHMLLAKSQVASGLVEEAYRTLKQAYDLRPDSSQLKGALLLVAPSEALVDLFSGF